MEESVCCCFCGKRGGKALFNRKERSISNGEKKVFFLNDEVWGERIIFMFWDLGAVEFEWVSRLVVLGNFSLWCFSSVATVCNESLFLLLDFAS